MRTGWFSILSLSLFVASSLAQEKPATPPATLTVDQVIAQLVAETATFDTTAEGYKWVRPHPLVQKLPKDSGTAVAQHLTDAFTNDPIKDTYIRYHLMYAALNSDDKAPGAPFAKLAEILPDDTGFKRKPDQSYEPVEIAREYWKLVGECQVTVGIPPFEKKVNPPESFEYMDDAQKQAAQAKWAKAQELRGKFKSIVDKDAAQWNNRMAWTPFMLRQVRGEALYGMVRSGEPKMLEQAVQLIARNTSHERRPFAMDYMAFLNATYFDGWLSQYDKGLLKQTSTALKRIAISADIDPKGRKIVKDSLAETAFTVVTAMDSGNLPTRPAKGDMNRPVPQGKPLPRRNVTAATLDIATIDDAINRAVTALDVNRPPDTDLGPQSYNVLYSNAYQRTLLLPGHQALASWAMLSAGEAAQAPWMQKRLGWTACYESVGVYDRAMRLRAIAHLTDPRWMPWIKRDADWLLAAMTPQGGFPDEYLGEETAAPNPKAPAGKPAAAKPAKPPTAEDLFGDNANSAYAILGLAGARRAGYEISDDTWKKIDTYWRKSQFPARVENGGGWAVRSYISLSNKDNPKEFANRVSAEMTAGGLLSLSITERFLLGPKRLGVGNQPTPEFAAGLDWLDKHFNFEDINADSDLYYYLWTIQNVGQATGYRTFNNVDWFREATARLLQQQRDDGMWKGPKGQTISTSFALLYLYRARGPLAFCKLQIDAGGKKPAWNNRPDDLYNLTDDISRRFEVPTSWQIAALDQPLYQLAESATLYLATDQAFELNDAQINNLRDYLNAGGMLICVPEGNNTANPLRSMRTLASKLYPNREPVKIARNHAFYTLNEKVAEAIPVSVIETSVRPLVAIIEKDIGKDLQADLPTRRDAHRLLTNIYLYATGRETARPRLAGNYIVRTVDAPKTVLQAARIKYNGDFDLEPLSLTQLGALLANKFDVDLKTQTLDATALTADTKIAFLSLSSGAKLDDASIAALKKWVTDGGTLWVDAAGGSGAAQAAVDQFVAALAPDIVDFKSAKDSSVLTGATTRPGVPITKIGYRTFLEGDPANLKVATINDRPAIYVTRGDLAAGLAGVNAWQIAGFDVPTARQIVANGVLDLVKPAGKPAKPIVKPATQPAGGAS